MLQLHGLLPSPEANNATTERLPKVGAYLGAAASTRVRSLKLLNGSFARNGIFISCDCRAADTTGRIEESDSGNSAVGGNRYSISCMCNSALAAKQVASVSKQNRARRR